MQHGKLALHGSRCPAAKSCCDSFNAVRIDLREAALVAIQARCHRLSAGAEASWSVTQSLRQMVTRHLDSNKTRSCWRRR